MTAASNEELGLAIKQLDLGDKLIDDILSILKIEKENICEEDRENMIEVIIDYCE